MTTRQAQGKLLSSSTATHQCASKQTKNSYFLTEQYLVAHLLLLKLLDLLKLRQEFWFHGRRPLHLRRCLLWDFRGHCINFWLLHLPKHPARMSADPQEVTHEWHRQGKYKNPHHKNPRVIEQAARFGSGGRHASGCSGTLTLLAQLGDKIP